MGHAKLTSSIPTNLRALLRYLTSAQRLKFAVLIVLMALGALAEVVSIGAILPVLKIMQQPLLLETNGVLLHISAALGGPSSQTLFLILLGGLLVFFVCKNAYLVLVDIFQYRFLARLQSGLSTRMMAGYLQRPYEFHIGSNSSHLIRNVTTEVSTVFYYSLVPFATLVSEVLVVVALFCLVLLIDRETALVLIGLGGTIVLLFYRVFRKRVALIGDKLQASSGKMIQYAQEGLGGVKEIKVLGREEYFCDAFGEQARQNSRTLSRALVIHNFPTHMLETVFTVIFVGLLIFQTVSGGGQDTVPVLGVYAAAAFRLIPSLNRIMTSVNRLKQSGSSLALVVAEASVPPSSKSFDQEPPIALRSKMTLDNIHYRYPQSAQSSLAGVSLVIQKGEMVGFVGKSGSGKTTLIDCILGLLSPTEGSIRVDGRDIRDGLVTWRQSLGYIPQSIYLTDDSILRNVAFGLPDEQIDEDKVWCALRAAALDDYVATLPDGANTAIGERGVRLSGGQRQRIGIARAMYRDPDVLILDEATSALDNATERAIVKTLGGLKGDKTIIVIAHRTTSIEDCDRVIELRDGKVAM